MKSCVPLLFTKHSLFWQQCTTLSFRRSYSQESNRRMVTSLKESSKAKVEYLPRIFSGIQPTGNIHLGNYFGAIRQWLDFQQQKVDGKYEHSIFSIVDLHAITLPQDRDSLQNAILECTATLLACGIDPNKSILFLQSHVPYHPQLSWVLGALTTMPRLSALPQFKEKSKNLKEVPVGLYTYPILQAADILLYQASHVPIGEDNLQQILFARHIAGRFNRAHGDTFVLPAAIILKDMSCRLRSLRKPENKMSKSEPDPKSRICIIDSPDEITEKIKKAVTDFTSAVTYDVETRPGVSNLIMLHSLCSGQPIDKICTEAQSIDTGKYKSVVSEAVVEYLRPIRNHLLDLLNDPVYLLDVLDEGANKATSLCQPIWEKVCYNVGISPSHSWITNGRIKSRF